MILVLCMAAILRAPTQLLFCDYFGVYLYFDCTKCILYISYDHQKLLNIRSLVTNLHFCFNFESALYVHLIQ